MWDFETDQDYQLQLDWATEFVREEVEPLSYVIPNVLDSSDPIRRDPGSLWHRAAEEGIPPAASNR